MIKTIAAGIVVALSALIFVVASEFLVVAWLQASTFDITGNFFLTGVAPVHFIVQGAIISATAPLLRRQPILLVGIYLVISLGSYFAMLSEFANPMADIIRYEISALISAVVWLFINRKRIFLPASTQ